MARERYSPAELDSRLKFTLGIILGLILLFTAIGILYGLLFVTQPVGAQSENDKMFFNVLGSIATFITGTLAGILIGQSGAKDIMKAQLDNKEMDAKNTQADKKLESELEIAELKADVEADAVRARLANKPDGAMPEEKPVDTDWDKD
jgi:signal transduction histidine kinase